MQYNFDTIFDRKGTNTFKWDNMRRMFGRNDLLPFWVADMDFPVSPEIQQALADRVSHGIYGYTFVPESAYEAVIGWCGERYGWEIEREWLFIANGVMPTVAFAIQAFSSPGDGVIVQPPVYYPFYSVVEKNERRLLLNTLVRDESGEYRINFAELEKYMKNGARLLLLCSPHNPVGRVWSRDELIEIGKLCVRYNVPVISDEIHADILFSGNRHLSFGALPEPYASKAVVALAPSKTFNIPGLTVSEVIIPDTALRERYSSYVHRFSMEIKNLFSVIGMEAAYRGGGPWLDELLVYLEGNIDYVEAYLQKELPEVRVYKPEGTYLVWLDFRALDEDGCGRRLVEEGKIGLNDGAVFGEAGRGFQRMNVACPRQTLREGLRRMAGVFV
jgi:cysteine-S-conjugate beta-lyase